MTDPLDELAEYLREEEKSDRLAVCVVSDADGGHFAAKADKWARWLSALEQVRHLSAVEAPQAPPREPTCPMLRAGYIEAKRRAAQSPDWLHRDIWITMYDAYRAPSAQAESAAPAPVDVGAVLTELNAIIARHEQLSPRMATLSKQESLLRRCRDAILALQESEGEHAEALEMMERRIAAPAPADGLVARLQRLYNTAKYECVQHDGEGFRVNYVAEDAWKRAIWAAWPEIVTALAERAPQAEPTREPPDIPLVPGDWPLIALGRGQIEVAEGHHEGVLALIFGRNGTGKIGEPTQPNRTHLPGETLAVVTFGNVESLDVVADKLAIIREKLAAPTAGDRQAWRTHCD